jgi:excisionase family DNA binding protein
MRAVMETTEAADYFSLHERMVAKLVETGKIPHRKVAKQLLFIQRDLDAWLDALPGRA